MRFIIYGVGAIGGTTAASLALAGQEVVGIAVVEPVHHPARHDPVGLGLGAENPW